MVALTVLGLSVALSWLGATWLREGCLPWEEKESITDTLHCDGHVSWRDRLLGSGS